MKKGEKFVVLSESGHPLGEFSVDREHQPVFYGRLVEDSKWTQKQPEPVEPEDEIPY